MGERPPTDDNGRPSMEGLAEGIQSAEPEPAATAETTGPRSEWSFDGSREAGVSISLSGGGHRATLMALGVLLAIVDTGWNRFTRSISSVSGGSLANAFVYSRCDYRNASPPEFSRLVRDAMTLVGRGNYVGTTRAKLRLSVWILALSAPVAASIAAFGESAVLGLATLAPVLVGFFLILAVRGRILGANLGELWIDGPTCRRQQFDGARAPSAAKSDLAVALKDMGQPTLHLIAATDLGTGEPVYFTQGALILNRMAWPLTTMRLARAVRASASVPFFLPRYDQLRRT